MDLYIEVKQGKESETEAAVTASKLHADSCNRRPTTWQHEQPGSIRPFLKSVASGVYQDVSDLYEVAGPFQLHRTGPLLIGAIGTCGMIVPYNSSITSAELATLTSQPGSNAFKWSRTTGTLIATAGAWQGARDAYWLYNSQTKRDSFEHSVNLGLDAGMVASGLMLMGKCGPKWVGAGLALGVGATLTRGGSELVFGGLRALELNNIRLRL